MRVRVLQHVPFEGLGSIEPWLSRRAAKVAWTRLHAGDALPDPDATDLVIALGGPMSVNDEGTLPWLRAEKRFLARAIDGGVAVVGICLGAQLIANALGAKVYANREREIGWHAVERVAEAETSRWARILPGRTEAFHWHGETFDLPPGALHLARSAGCEHQAFALGERVLALQFHLETTIPGARALIEHCPADLAPGAFVQDAAQILAEPDRFERIQDAMLDVLEHLTERLA